MYFLEYIFKNLMGEKIRTLVVIGMCCANYLWNITMLQDLFDISTEKDLSFPLIRTQKIL
jgi:hypothetical protein